MEIKVVGVWKIEFTSHTVPALGKDEWEIWEIMAGDGPFMAGDDHN